MEYREHEEFRNRMLKLSELKERGIDPYPHKFDPNTYSSNLKSREDAIGHSEDAANGTTEYVKAAGRLVLFRAMGKNAFGHLLDSQGKFQVMFNRELTQLEGFSPDETIPSALKCIEKKIDLGDWVGVEGHLFRTNTGEVTIFAKRVVLLSKSLLPLPDKHAGLTDKETRYRKRWLDLIDHEEVRHTFSLRSQILKLVREYFDAHKFQEVETPVLQNVYGGANAKPFTTHLNALDQEMFLRISLELPLKKLIVGGLERVFEIGKVFRNEGIDRTHNPEFTMLETYAAFWDYHDMMRFCENLFEYVAMKLFNTTVLKVNHPETGEVIDIDVKAPWKRVSMKQAVLDYGKYDVDKLSDDDMRLILEKTGNFSPKDLQKTPRGLLIAKFFEEFAEKHLIQPHHIIDHPIETTPLCKLHRNPTLKQERIVERFESFILTKEMSNAYSELNDPVLQRELLEDQAAKKESGDEEACPLDEEFLESICQGMPPTGGLGIGIDRLVMLFANAHSIRDILFFPLMKPQS